MTQQIPGILLTAGTSGTGKTMLTCGILQAFKERGLKLASFKCGPDYIDPMFHKEVLGVDSYNLDIFLCGREKVKNLFMENAKGTDLAVLEGVMGYYDGLAGISSQASAYDVAKTTHVPAVLIVDCKGMSVSVVPYVQGFLNYKADSRIKGIILNRVSPMMYSRMKQMIETETPVKVYGYMPVMKECAIESRYLGLKMPHEDETYNAYLKALGTQAEKTIDLDGLLALAVEECNWEDARVDDDTDSIDVKKKKLRIGLAKDEAFCFIYKDNLKILEKYGAKILPFSPVHDKKLPERLDGLLLYGGYPELYAKKLSENESMRREIKDVLKRGLPCIAECGGFMYLMEYMKTKEGEEYPMAGVLAGGSFPTSSLKRFGYVTLTGGKVFGEDAGEIPAHEFHYYDSENCGNAFLAEKPLSERKWECMVSTASLFAGYPHIHYGGNPKVAEVFLKACRDREI